MTLLGQTAILCTLLLFCAGMTGAVAAMQASRADAHADGLYLVVTTDRDRATASVQAAGGQLVGPEQAPLALLARLDPTAGDALADAPGVMMLVPAAGLAAICSFDTKDSQGWQ
jgi:hypothetical protein